MDVIAALQSLNYIAAAIATIASYVLGFTWYHWAVFGEAWANALGLTKEQANSTEGLGGAFTISLVSGLTKSILIAALISATNTTGIIGGLFLGAIIATILTATSLAYYNGFARTQPKLTLVNAAHSITELALIGAVIGLFS